MPIRIQRKRTAECAHCGTAPVVADEKGYCSSVCRFWGTSAMYYDWLPPTQQEGGWGDAAGLIYMQRGYLRRDRFADLYDLLDADINAEVPDDMLVPVEDAGAES